MNYVKRFSRLRGCGIFRDCEWRAELPEFGQYNLIYGWNGTGKTTLSRILRSLEKRTVPEGQHVTVKLGDWELQGGEFSNASVPVRVFNRDFITENVFPIRGGDLPPIFVLGKENIEKQKDVERLKEKRANAQSKLASARANKQGAEKQFDQFCIDHAKSIKDTLRSSGTNLYNNYDKSRFRKDAEEMAAAGDGQAHRLSDSERDKLLTQHRATPKQKLQELSYALPNFDEIITLASGLLAMTVVSKAIDALKSDHELAKWAREGLQIHRGRKAERCLFCEQTLPKNRLQALEAHFSAEYEQFMQRLDKFIGDLKASSESASKLRWPNKAELYDDLAAEYEAAEADLRKAMEATREFLEAVVQAVDEKKGRPFDRIDRTLLPPQVDVAAVVENMNAVLRKHNQACNDFQTRVNEARDQLARDMIAEALEEFRPLRNEAQKAKESVDAAEKEVRDLDAEIARLEREIVEHRRPAEELNEDLRKYLGHGELRVEIRDTGYAISRGNVPAHSLSEGEMTAIALLYFLKTLQDKSFDLTEGIVVLDDPVSSLDANALYLAFGFIRERTKDAGQLFILTHNFTFFRQARNWFHHLPGQRKNNVNERPARFYMIDCVRKGTERCANIRGLDPLLEQYDSEYHYLFARIYRAANKPSDTGLEQNYELPNMARRLLEGFLAFRCPDVSGELWKKLQNVEFDEARKTRILRFVHTHSHADATGELEHDPSLLAETPSVLKDLLELMKSQDLKHYEAMERLLDSSEPEGAAND